MFLAVSGATSLADVGLVTTLSKHVAEFYALKDFRSLSRFINTGFVLYLGLACLLAGTLWVSSPFLLRTLFRTSSVPTPELRILWRYLILLVFANTITLLFSSVVTGLQRMDLSTCIGSINLLLSASLSVMFLNWSLSLRGILYAYVIAAWFTSLAYIYVVHHLLPEIKLNPAACRWTVAREILSFSMKTYITQVAVVIHNQTEKIYLANFVGVASVGWYDIASDLALKLRGIPGLVLAPVMPAASELHALTDRSRLAHLYYRAHKYLAFIGVPLVVYVVFVSRGFVQLWVGPTLSVIAVPLSVLLVVNFINLTTGPGLQILVGGARLRPGVYSALLGIVLNLTLSLFLIRAYGFQGAVIGTSLSMVIASVFFLYMFHCETAGSYSNLIRSVYAKPILCSLLIVGLLWAVTRVAQPSWRRLATEGVIFGVAYLVLLLVFRFFDRLDLEIAERFLPIPGMARRLIPDVELGSTLLPDSESTQTTIG
ncbi:MAG: polysaccharide biosynthesis C-terminal domain-containing protein [Acidobacteriia bacterium]|nr:polysaccharide biosynthesis C-terminal domain-containing protein [Terriglobia bacterium]